jgi:hypothetical protein
VEVEWESGSLPFRDSRRNVSFKMKPPTLSKNTSNLHKNEHRKWRTLPCNIVKLVLQQHHPSTGAADGTDQAHEVTTARKSSAHINRSTYFAHYHLNSCPRQAPKQRPTQSKHSAACQRRVTASRNIVCSRQRSESGSAWRFEQPSLAPGEGSRQ